MAAAAASSAAAAAASVRSFLPTPSRELKTRISLGRTRRSGRAVLVTAALSDSKGAKGVNNSNYVVPLDKAISGITRPLAEILRDLNKRVPDNIINTTHNDIPWYHVNRMLSFYAPGWCGEVRDIVYSDNGTTVTVVYRVTIRGSDGEAHRESTATVSLSDGISEDPVAAAEETAFCRACARFGFGLYLYHEDEVLQE